MSTGHFAGVAYHRRMLADTHRTESFARAIEALVGPDDVVVDVGAGTGILSMLAARAGARRVFAVESTPMAKLAKRIVAANGFEDRITVFEADAREVELPEKATLLVSECLGNFIFSDGMLKVLSDCRRLLTPDAKICPQTLELQLAPASVDVLMDGIGWWEEPKYGFSFGPALASAENDLYHFQLPSGLVSAEPRQIFDMALTDVPPTELRPAHWTFSEQVMVDAVVGWFTAHLTDDIILSTAPGSNTHWGQIVFPIPPVRVDPGDQLHFEIDVRLGWEDLPNYHWSGAYLDAAGRDAVVFERGQDFRFEPWRARDES